MIQINSPIPPFLATLPFSAWLDTVQFCDGSDVLTLSRVSHRVSCMIQGDAHIVFLALGKNGDFQKGSWQPSRLWSCHFALFISTLPHCHLHWHERIFSQNTHPKRVSATLSQFSQKNADTHLTHTKFSINIYWTNILHFRTSAHTCLLKNSVKAWQKGY